MLDSTIEYIASYMLDNNLAFAKAGKYCKVYIIHKATGKVLLIRDMLRGFTYINNDIKKLCMTVENVVSDIT